MIVNNMTVKTSYKNIKQYISKCRVLLNYTNIIYLFAVVCNGLQDGTQRLETDCHIQKMGSKEEVVEISHNGESEIP